MAEIKGKVAPPEHSLTRMFYEEAMTPFLVLSLIMGTAGCAAVILVWLESGEQCGRHARCEKGDERVRGGASCRR